MLIAMTLFILILTAVITCVIISFVIPIRKENRRIRREKDFYSNIHVGADGELEQDFYSYDGR